MKPVTLKIKVDAQLAETLEPILLERNISLDEAVGLYLRAMVNNIESGKALGLDSKMPFGKYKGEYVEVIAKGDPGYLRWMLGRERPLNVLPDVLEYLK